ncbi:DUF6477 family protein [Phaeovulum sp.]|uniref:DUF6477 family protein n=1 Tax=Phaeovulum sp. TaxID=2934796 RepID=UPI0039E652E4
MTDLISLISDLRRPRLLISAARFGLTDYNRNRDLRRLLRLPTPPRPERALVELITEEARLDGCRREGGAGYSLTRHIEILIALMGEARLLPPPLNVT